MEEITSIAGALSPIDTTGILAELIEAKGGRMMAGEAQEAVEELYAADPGAAEAVREAFLAIAPADQEEMVEALAGSDDTARRTWSRLLFGIVEREDGTAELA